MKYLYIYLEKFKKNYFNTVIIFFIWSSLYVSLNTNFVTIFILFENFNFINIIKARSILVIISFFLIIFFIFKYSVKLKNNFFYFILLFILAIQSIYFFSEDFDLFEKISIINIYEKNLFSKLKYGLQLQAVQLFLSIFISLFLIIIFNKKKNEDAFVFTFLCFLTVFCIFYICLLIASLPSHIYSHDILLYYNSFFAHEDQILTGEPAIKVTGVSRALLIISLIFFFIYNLFSKNKYLKYIFLLLLILINTSIILSGSRFALYSLLISYSFLFLLLNRNIKEKIIFFLMIIIVPIVLFFSIGSILKVIQSNNEVKELIKNVEDPVLADSMKKNFLNKNKGKDGMKFLDGMKFFKNNRYVEQINNTSGRVQIWKNAFEVSQEKGNHFFGNGVNADRRLLVKYKNLYGTNTSNGILNIYLTSGILGLILFFLANLIVLIKIYKLIFIKKCFLYFDKYYLTNFSIIITFVFYQRIIFENSITSFGLDYLLYIMCCYFILNKIKTVNIFSK